MTRLSHWLGAAGALALAGLAAPAYAQTAVPPATQAGVTITNTVTVAYKVGGVDQTSKTASDTFTVDRKVNVTVEKVDTASVQVSPGQVSAMLTFKVTNQSNATLDWALAAVQPTTDNFDTTALKVFVDTNKSGAYDAGDQQVSYIDELASDTSRLVFVLSDVPLTRATNDIAVVTLTATGREGGGTGSEGAGLAQTTTANTSGMDTVYADGQGATDGTRDAAHSANNDYKVFAAALTVAKTSKIISDPVNLTNNPKMIPGATVEYCIAVANASGGAAASDIRLSDVLPTSTTYLSSFGVKLNGTVTGGACNADGPDAGAHAAGTVTGTIASVAAGGVKTMLFRVTIN